VNFLKKIYSVLFIVCLFSVSNAKAGSIEFNKQQLATIKTQNIGKQWLILLWSVDCPPCLKELAIMQQLQNQHDDLAVVIINTDANDETNAERDEIIEQFELNYFANFHFVDGKGDQSRFIIDASWYGELPRSYFIERNGKFHGKSGLVNKSILRQWLVQ